MRHLSSFLFSVIMLFGIVAIVYADESTELKDYQQTGLPVCYITFDDGLVITKEEKIAAELTIVDDTDTLNASVSISGRGNSTWIRDKKPYNIKFDKAATPLGLKAGKKFALLANDYDPSKLRTAIGFAVGEWVGADYPLHGRYVELVINGVHKGNYYLTDRVCQAALDLNKKKSLILEYKYPDQLDPDGVNFVTDKFGYYMEFKDPDEPTVGGEMYEAAVKSINDFEEALYADDYLTARRWASKINMDNFVKWYYSKNLLQMDECNRYYVIEDYTDDTPKIKMGPLWDFDWTMGWQIGETHYDYQYMRNKLYFERISDDIEFNRQVAALHLSLRSSLKERINNIYDSLTVKLRKSVMLDDKIWWHANPLDWDKELQTDRDYLLATIHFLDAQLKPYMDQSGVDAVNADPLPVCKLLRNGKFYILKGAGIYDAIGNRLNPSELK